MPEEGSQTGLGIGFDAWVSGGQAIIFQFRFLSDDIADDNGYGLAIDDLKVDLGIEVNGASFSSNP